MPNDKYEEIENEDLQTPGVRPEDDDDDLDLDDGMDVDEPETVGTRHPDQDPESGKSGFDKDMKDDERIPQDSDPSE